MQKKTLGGDRLGTGRKMQVELSNYERSTHDLSYIWRSSMSAGTLVPFMSKVLLPGDSWDIKLDCDVKTLPTVGPLFGSYKVQLDTFVIPMRLYNSLLHNNMLGIGLDMSKVKIPKIEFDVPITVIEDDTDIDNLHINPSNILSYLGLRGWGINDTEAVVQRQFNAIPLLAYWEIYKNYYANKQEGIGAVIHTADNSGGAETIAEVGYEDPDLLAVVIPQAPNVASQYVRFVNGRPLYFEYTGTTPNPKGVYISFAAGPTVSFYDLVGGVYTDDGSIVQGVISYQMWGDMIARNWSYTPPVKPMEVIPTVTTFDLDNLDTMRREVLKFDSESTPFLVNTPDLEPYNYLTDDVSVNLASQEGLALKTYQSDQYNNWLATEFIDAISTASAVSTVGDSFTIDQLNLSQKVYEMLNRIAVSGGSYNDWIEAAYGINKMRLPESPVYMGGLSKELVFQEVISNSETNEQPLGTLAGRGRLSQKHKGGWIDLKVEEPSYVMGIISLTPRIDYSQGNQWDVNLDTIDDLHKPGLDQIGFQDLVTEQMAWWDTEYVTDTWVQKSAGKQPAWINYMTDTNVTRGNFAIAANQMFMTLNRRYEFEEGTGIVDLTTYIDPSKYNFIFAQTALDAQNFWVQVGCSITARRKMSAKIMPNL